MREEVEILIHKENRPTKTHTVKKHENKLRKPDGRSETALRRSGDAVVTRMRWELATVVRDDDLEENGPLRVSTDA